MLPSALQVRITSPPNRICEAEIKGWTLPAWLLSTVSYSVSQGVGTTDPCIVISSRVAELMNIRDGDKVVFEVPIADHYKFKSPVKVSQLPVDCLIHGGFGLKLLKDFSVSGDVARYTFCNDKNIELPHQSLWAGMRAIFYRGSVVLSFDGASRNNPNGPAGFGYSLVMADTKKPLIHGHGYFEQGTSNQMEYHGLWEGLCWVIHMNAKYLTIKGDSELVIKQCKGEWKCNNAKLREYLKKIQELLAKMRDGTTVVFEHVPREQNERADLLANLAIDSQSHATVCTWNNLNAVIKNDF